VQQEPTGIVAAVIVFFAASIVSSIGWVPLSVPPRLIRLFLPNANCASVRSGTDAMFFCSARIGLLTIASPLIIMLVLYVLRGPLSRWVEDLSRKLPPETRFLVAPLAATIVFTMSWAGMHPNASYSPGLLSQAAFPAVVGVYTYAVARWGNGIARALGPSFFAKRDRYPPWVRVAAAAAVPILLSLLMASASGPRVTDSTYMEQIIVLVALVCGHLAMTPPSGDLLAGMRQIVQRTGAVG
jgi:hypothetical protein